MSYVADVSEVVLIIKCLALIINISQAEKFYCENDIKCCKRKQFSYIIILSIYTTLKDKLSRTPLFILNFYILYLDV